MNDTNNSERNEQMVRIMAVIGFVVLVCLLAWLAVQAIRFIPTAFSSLANIFEANQRDYEEEVHDNDVVVVEDDEDTDEEEVTGNDNKTPDTVATSTPPTPVPVTPKPTPVQYKTVTTYKIPVSDPNGKIDLAASFVTFGAMNSQGRFVPQAELSSSDQGAVQFVIKNNGTKTSGEWTFEAILPNGSKMNSKVQAPLKPSESSTLTVVFGKVDKSGNHSVDVGAIVGQDVNPANNAFRTTLRVK